MSVPTIIGFRWWILGDDGLVHPIFRENVSYSYKGANHAWQPGVNEAECNNHYNHDPVDYPPYTKDVVEKLLRCSNPPGATCTCGLYATHEPQENPAKNIRSLDERLYIFGAIQAWGQVYSGVDEYRARYARIVAFAANPDPDATEAIHKVAKTYQVPVVPEDLLVFEAMRHGTPLHNDRKLQRIQFGENYYYEGPKVTE